MNHAMRLLAGLILAAPLCAGDALEVHSFASVGGYRTWGNNWLSASDQDGSVELWEFAINASVTPFVDYAPLDRLRLNTQVFARDLGVYDNGKIQLDLANADYRFSDLLGLQVGRVRLPVGLYNEILDIDTARVPIFLPIAVYSLRARDLYLSTDGAKLYGYLNTGGESGFEYAVYGGDKHYDRRAGFAAYFSDLGYGPEIENIDIDLLAGGMLHWHTPVQGLGLRISGAYLRNFDVAGFDPTTGIRVSSHADRYLQMIAAVQYQRGTLTVAAEYQRLSAHNDTTISLGGTVLSRFDVPDQSSGAYLSATWNVMRSVDLYGALEGNWRDATDERMPSKRSLVGAVRWDPYEHLLIKAEVSFVRSATGLSPALNPGGLEEHWWLAALKTTVDF